MDDWLSPVVELYLFIEFTELIIVMHCLNRLHLLITNGLEKMQEKASDVLKIEYATYWTAFRRPTRFLFTIVPVTNDSAFQAVIVLLW